MNRKTVVCIFRADDERTVEERLALAAKIAFGIEQSPVTWELIRGKRGKPFFLHHPELFLSISHSGPYWVCALGGERVGVDIQEKTKKRGETQEGAGRRLLRLAERHFEPEESDYVENGRLGTVYSRFFEIWAAKESYVKYTGRGIDGGFGKFSVMPQEETVLGDRLPWQASGAWFWKTELRGGFVLCVCTGKEREIALEWMTE